MEQRTGKLNSSTASPAEDTVPLPIRPLPTAQVITSHKRDSLTSSDSGVGSPHVFSPTLPITPEQQPPHSQETEHEQPSTSASTGPLTPIQQFLRYSRQSKAREPKYFRPQPHDPNSQSALRTLTRQGFKLWSTTIRCCSPFAYILVLWKFITSIIFIPRARCLNVINSTQIASGRLPTVGLTWRLTQYC